MKGVFMLKKFLSVLGAIGAIRTRDLLLRRQLLYPTELQPHSLQIISQNFFFANFLIYIDADNAINSFYRVNHDYTFQTSVIINFKIYQQNI